MAFVRSVGWLNPQWAASSTLPPCWTSPVNALAQFFPALPAITELRIWMGAPPPPVGGSTASAPLAPVVRLPTTVKFAKPIDCPEATRILAVGFSLSAPASSASFSENVVFRISTNPLTAAAPPTPVTAPPVVSTRLRENVAR